MGCYNRWNSSFLCGISNTLVKKLIAENCDENTYPDTEEPTNQIANITISGLVKVGETLSAEVTDLNGLPSNIKYRWYVDEALMLGVTSETYVLEESDSGKTITVKVTFTDKDGFSETVSDSVYVEVVEVVPREGTLKFTTRNIVNPSKKMKGTIMLSGLSGEWQLLGGDTVLHSNESTGNPTHHAVQLTDWFAHEPVFEFIGTASRIDIDLPNGFAGVKPIGEVIIQSFSETVAHQTIQASASLLTVPETLPPNITSTNSMFRFGSEFNQDISMWDTSNVTDMGYMFAGASSFNQDISGWNVGQVTNMDSMFDTARSFNQDLSGWNVSLIPSEPNSFDYYATSWTLPKPTWNTVEVDMGLKSDYTGTGWYKTTDTGTVFNKDVPALETHVFSDSPIEYVSVHTAEEAKLYGARAAVSNITNMDSLFANDSTFNHNISSWDVSNVTSMLYMFGGASSFNHNISNWDVSSVTDMASMFDGASSFNRDLSSWDVSNVTDISGMFYNAKAFNGDISTWDISSVNSIYLMFDGASSFNQDISNWNVSGVDDMDGMFDSATSFNQNLSSWDVSNVENMSNMFANATSFNGDISTWNTSNVTDMSKMFSGATAFNQDLSRWDVGLILVEPDNFSSNTSSWTLPKPVWGNDIGVSELGEPYLFSTTNVATPTSELMLIIDMYNYTKWQLVDTDTGLVIANSKRYFAPGIQDNQSESNAASLVLRRSKTGVSNYALYVKSDSVTFSNQGSGDTVSGTFTLTQWGTMSPNPRFMLKGTTTTVPDTLSEAVTSADLMFSRNNLFNQDISGWETGHLVSATSMFEGASKFNQDLSGWNVLNISSEPSSFASNASAWTLPRPIWGTNGIETGLKADYLGRGWYKATDTGTVFNKGVPEGETHVFKDSLKEYVSVYTKEDVRLYSERAAVSNVTDMSYMFTGVNATNPDISSWDVSSVTNMFAMFLNNTSFNQDISMWDTSSVTDMKAMFEGASAFNQDISKWNSSSVTDMNSMFRGASSFNSDISNWDTSLVTDMGIMFYSASSFNQDLSGWNVTNFVRKPDFFDGLTTSWASPRPVWGTDGKAVIEAVLPTSLHFSSHNSKVGTHGLIIDLWLYRDAIDSEWQVYESGKLIASNEKPYRDGVTYKPLASWSPPNAVNLILNLAGKDHEYEVRGAAESIYINNMDTATPDDTLTVHQFPSVDTGISISVSDALLTVPDSIPTTYTSTSGMFMECYNFNQDISGWDVSNITDMAYMFSGASAFNQPIGQWNTSKVTDMSGLFDNATAFNQDVGSWDTSNVVDMSYMFNEVVDFNRSLSNWDVSSVTDMGSMFRGANTFRQDLSSWNVSNVENMSYMFSNAYSFDSDMSSWNVSSVTDMSYMFGGAYSFTSNLYSWNVGSVTNMKYMFGEAYSFDSDISNWNVSNVTNINSMFYDASEFNQDLSSWDVSKVTDMDWVFGDATSFNSELSSWDVSKATTMNSMFYNASSFNQDISSWNVSNVTNMKSMFEDAILFNQDISGWDTSNVTNMNSMLYNTPIFNQDISLWNVSKVTDMEYMFGKAASFNSNISSWNTSNVANMGEMFDNATSFNQDLSNWCVPLIATKPEDFDTSATAWTLAKPVWGTCPRGEAG